MEEGSTGGEDMGCVWLEAGGSEGGRGAVERVKAWRGGAGVRGA